MKRALASAFQMIIAIVAYPQDFPRQGFDLEKIADEIFPIQDLDLNYEEYYENLAQQLANPLDLNKVTREQLRSLFVLTEQQINSFLEYRQSAGTLLSVYELQIVPGWDRTAFDKVIPFLIVIDPQEKLDNAILKRFGRAQTHYLVARYDRVIEAKQGYRNETDSVQKYAGSPDRIYLRYRLARSNDFSFGFTLEKDAGEAIEWSPPKRQYGFDFLSFHAQVQRKGRLRNLVVGDFQSQFGQGLGLGSVFGFGKNSESITTVRRSNLGFMPYTSLNETQFFRGLAASISLTKGVTLHGFGSYVMKDGSPADDTDDSLITSFSTSGLHRTSAERSSRKLVGETDLGGALQFKNQSLDAGLLFHHTGLNAPVHRNPTAYNSYFFGGAQNQVATLFLNYSWANFTIFSEASANIGHGSAFVAGLLGSITPELESALLLRNYTRDYNSFTANAFSENTLAQNERGFYWGWKYKFNRRFAASGYIDLFQFPWLRYRGYAPSEGAEWLLHFTYAPSRSVHFFIQAREESKTRNLSGPGPTYLSASGVKRNYWINCDYSVPPFGFKSRVQASTYALGDKMTHGFALIQDASLTLKKWTFSFRYALFDTDDYDNRLYVYERDVWLAYSFPAYYGVGLRKYGLVQYKLSERIDLWLRWSTMAYADRTEIGSGGELVQGNTRNDVKFQVRVQF